MTTPDSIDVAGCAVSADLSSLTFHQAGHASVVLAAETLRASCKCAHCLRARFDNRFPESFPRIAIVGVTDLGYGLNIAFSDGHNRGIYPRSYLASLALS